MNTDNIVDVEADDSTGLPWPRTWKGTYLLVVCSFVLWLVLLFALTECGA
jgi:hypothetical protein